VGIVLAYLEQDGDGYRLMAKLLYCWRCRMHISMLDEAEWEQVLWHLRNGLEQIKDYRRVHNTSLAEAKAQVYGRGALERYHQITGFHERQRSMASPDFSVRSALFVLWQAPPHIACKLLRRMRSATTILNTSMNA
jgi:hypothetical protein